jgi:spore coat polysaccharide biosynthesis protein SpsF (cytidylyltransferase family)
MPRTNLRVVMSLSRTRDKDIIEFLGDDPRARTIRIKAAIRKLIDYDRMFERALVKGFGSEVPKAQEDPIRSSKDLDDVVITTSDKAPVLSDAEIARRLEQF